MRNLLEISSELDVVAPWVFNRGLSRKISKFQCKFDRIWFVGFKAINQNIQYIWLNLAIYGLTRRYAHLHKLYISLHASFLSFSNKTRVFQVHFQYSQVGQKNTFLSKF